MPTHQERPTAKIYAFPSKSRAASGNRQAYAPKQQQSAAHFAAAEFGSGWYHDAAIEAADDEGDLGHQQH